MRMRTVWRYLQGSCKIAIASLFVTTGCYVGDKGSGLEDIFKNVVLSRGDVFLVEPPVKAAAPKEANGLMVFRLRGAD